MKLVDDEPRTVILFSGFISQATDLLDLLNSGLEKSTKELVLEPGEALMATLRLIRMSRFATMKVALKAENIEHANVSNLCYGFLQNVVAQYIGD